MKKNKPTIVVNLHENLNENDFDESVGSIKSRASKYDEYFVMINDGGTLRTEEGYKFKRFSPIFLMRLQKLINDNLNEMFEYK